MNLVIIGASSGLGRVLASGFAEAGHNLVIVSSDKRDVDALAADLSIRHSVRIIPVQADLGNENGYENIIFNAAEKFGKIHGLLFPVGATWSDDDGTISPERASQLMRINFLSIVAIIEKFLPMLRCEPYSVIIGFGSIAATRGRGKNVVYAAAKRALTSYFESLRDVCANSNINVQYYILGYLDTNLSFGIYTLFPKANPLSVSNHVISKIHRQFGVAYYPKYWKYICWMVKLTPWFIFKHLRF